MANAERAVLPVTETASTISCDRARIRRQRRPGSSTTSIARGTTGSAGSTDRASSTSRSGGTSASATSRDFSPYRETFAGWEFTAGDFAAVRLDAGRLRLCRSALRRRVHAVRARWVLVGRSGAHGRMAGAASGPVVLVNQATPRIKSLYAALGYDAGDPRRPAPNQLHGRPHASKGSVRPSEPVTPRSREIAMRDHVSVRRTSQ